MPRLNNKHLILQRLSWTCSRFSTSCCQISFKTFYAKYIAHSGDRLLCPCHFLCSGAGERGKELKNQGSLLMGLGRPRWRSRPLSSLTWITGTSKLETHRVKVPGSEPGVLLLCILLWGELRAEYTELQWNCGFGFVFSTEAPFQHRQHFLLLKLLWGKQVGRFDITELESSSLRDILWNISLVLGAVVSNAGTEEGGSQLCGKWIWSRFMCSPKGDLGVLWIGSDLISSGCWSCWKHLQH